MFRRKDIEKVTFWQRRLTDVRCEAKGLTNFTIYCSPGFFIERKSTLKDITVPGTHFDNNQ